MLNSPTASKAEPFKGMAHFLGLPGSLTSSAEETAGCQHRGEEQTFRSTCKASIDDFNQHLELTRRVRGLWLIFGGISEWGWGNMLPSVYALHWLCRLAQRYCYVSLQDQDIGSVLGYANGDSWHVHDRHGLHSQYGHNVTELKKGFSWSLFDNSTRLFEFASMLRQEESRLVEVSFPHAWPLLSNALSAFKQAEGGRLSVNDGGLRLRSTQGGLDRCFCRFVTQPLLLHTSNTSGAGGSLSGMGSRLQAELQRAEAEPPGTALHLRTMSAFAGFDPLPSLWTLGPPTSNLQPLPCQPEQHLVGSRLASAVNHMVSV